MYRTMKTRYMYVYSERFLKPRSKLGKGVLIEVFILILVSVLTLRFFCVFREFSLNVVF